MNIAIVETYKTGHHMEYIYGLCHYLYQGRRVNNISLYCDEYLYQYISENKLEPFDLEDGIKVFPGKLKNPEGGWIRNIINCNRNLKILRNYDRIIFLSINVYLFSLLLFQNPGFKFTGIYFNPYVRQGFTTRNILKWIVLKLIVKKYPDSIFCILNDLNVTELLNKKFKTFNFRMINDPIPDFYYKKIYTHSKRTAETTFSLLGSVSRRKGVFEFLDAIELSEADNSFVIAGKIEGSISSNVHLIVKRLIKLGKKVQLLDRFFSNEEFVQLISDSDYIVMPYLSHGASSGILGHAAIMKKRVIGPKDGLIGMLIKRFKLGILIEPKDTNDFAANISINNPRELSLQELSGMEEYVRMNSSTTVFSKIAKLTFSDRENNED